MSGLFASPCAFLGPRAGLVAVGVVAAGPPDLDAAADFGGCNVPVGPEAPTGAGTVVL